MKIITMEKRIKTLINEKQELVEEKKILIQQKEELLQEKETLEKVDLRKLKQKIMVLKNENSDLEEVASKNEVEIKDKKNENKKYIEMIFEGFDSYYALEEVLEEKKFKILMKIKNQILNKENIYETAKVGEEFDEDFHEILNADEPLSRGDGKIKIKNIVNQGYKQEEKILRIAKVIVE